MKKVALIVLASVTALTGCDIKKDEPEVLNQWTSSVRHDQPYMYYNNGEYEARITQTRWGMFLEVGENAKLINCRTRVDDGRWRAHGRTSKHDGFHREIIADVTERKDFADTAVVAVDRGLDRLLSGNTLHFQCNNGTSARFSLKGITRTFNKTRFKINKKRGA